MASDEQVLAVDIGGTKTAVAVVRDGHVLERREAATPAAEGPAGVIAVIDELIKPWLPQVCCLGVAATGLVRDGRVWAINQRTMPGWHGFPLREELERVTALPVALLNDAGAAAWGEFRFGAGRGHTSMMFLTVSTGIGGGVILGGTLWVGSAGFAGHVGHILADPTGPVCGCGRVGCLEAVASGKAIAREGTRIAGKPVNAKEVFALAKEGEAWAEALLLKSAERVAGAVADIKAMQDPELLVIGGSVGLNPTYLKLLKEMLSRFPVIYRLPLVAAHLGAEAGLVGAAAWAQIQ